MNDNTATKQAKEETPTLNKNNSANAELVKNAEEKVKSAAGQVSETINAYKEKAFEYTQQGLDKANQLKRQAADALASSTDYIKNLDLEETRQQLRATVKERPEVSIAIAGIFGLLIGLIIGRRTK
ncbi:MAG: DUF883 family protein [Pyrinomonadaceae bacterium]